MTVSYNVFAVKIYNAKNNCLVRFENKNIFFCFEKRSSLLHRCTVVVVNFKVVEWAPAGPL
jgi:hypothetical protein